MKSRFKALFLCSILSIVTVFQGCQTNVFQTAAISMTTAETAFKPVEMIKVGDHTYYQSDLFEIHKEDKEGIKEMLSIFEEADKSLDTDVFLTGYSVTMVTGKNRLSGFLLNDGVIYEELYQYADYENGVYAWTKKYDDVAIPGKPDLIDATTLYKDIYDLAVKHKDEMFIGDVQQPIYGTYYLQGHLDGSFYYDFKINENSAVWVDAVTGEVIHTYFFNGLYT